MAEQTGWDDLPPGIARVQRRRKPRIANTDLGTVKRNGLTESALEREDIRDESLRRLNKARGNGQSTITQYERDERSVSATKRTR